MPIPALSPGLSTRGQAVNDLLEATALQSAALAALLITHQELLSSCLAAPCPPGQALSLCREGRRLLQGARQLEQLQQRRLELLQGYLQP